MAFQLPPIYPITDKRLSGRQSHLAIVRELVRGGAVLVQVRDKETPAAELLTDLCRCAEYCGKHGVLLLVNDRCDLVLSCGAGGVHLGQDDLPPAAARAVLPRNRVIGFSTHTLAQVRRSNSLPIDYIGFGPVYATKTKGKTSPVVGITGLQRACEESRRPVVAIGGIGQERIAEVLRAGASSVAVISALMKAENIARRMQELLDDARVRL